MGRPTVMTEETVSKLEQAFAIGCPDEEACFFADISKQTLYDYQKKYPEFIDRKEALKNRPVLKARQTVVKELDKNYGNAMDYLKRKRKPEFGDNVDVTSDGERIGIAGMNIINDNEQNNRVPNKKSKTVKSG